MPLRVKCSAGHLMMVPDHRAGTVLRCANCGIDVQVPSAPGTPAKEPLGPRISAPAIQRPEVRQSSGPAARQSPQVAGHSTAAKSGINLPTVGKKKPSLPRTSAPSLPAAEKKSPPEPVVTPESIIIAPSEVVPPPVVVPPPIANVEVRVEPPPPVSKKPPAHQTPPLEDAPARRREPEPSRPPAKPSNRPRMTLTGTMLSPDPEPVLEKPTPENQIPERPAPAKPAAKLTETRVDLPREPVAEKAEKPATKAEPAREVEAPPIEPPPQVESPQVESKPAFSAPHTAPAFHSAATQVDPAPPPQFIMQGVLPSAAQRLTVWQLAAALLAALLLSIGPSLWEISDYLRSENGHNVARWAFLLLMLGVMQFGCILLLVQVPDWSSVWIVTLMSLSLAAIYAAVLGLTIITSGDSPLIGALQLDYQYQNRKAQPWCVCLAATYACLAFFAGRISAKWRKVLKQVQAAEAAAGHAH